MNKVNILTIQDPIGNYGNRLQNYAGQTIVEKLGFSVTSIFYTDTRKQLLKFQIQRMFGYHLPGDKEYWKYKGAKKVVFTRFDKQFIKHKYVDNSKELNIGQNEFWMIGSDQVWNPIYYSEFPQKKDWFLLKHVDHNHKICMAPSFGCDELPDEWKDEFRKALLTFPYLSVREQSGADIIKQLTGRDAEVVIDPTLMLDAKEWRKLEKNPKKVDCTKRYLLTYFLVEPNEEVNQLIQKYAEENQLEILSLLDPSDYLLYLSGPQEFLYLIDHATLILTDSFHASVFSFLFNKPFQVFDRGEGQNMSSRIETLTKTFHLERKYYSNQLPNDLFEHDYREGYEELKKEREKGLEFLKKSFGLR